MLFSSPIFFVFFVAYFALHLALPGRFRIYLIIVGSTVFYGWWKIGYAWLPYGLMAVAFFGTLWMDRAALPAARQRRAVATIVLLFAPLVFFKYTDFVYRDVIGLFAGFGGKLLDLPLPLGLSFVTFTLTAYVVDAFKRRFPASRSGATVLGYVLFFPHLIAGPILRPVELIPQLLRPRPASLRRLAAPVAIFSVGLVKKLVFADQVADAVDRVYGQAEIGNALDALLAIYGFSVQIYCDFSGYTDMAIGLALMLGIRLPNNFRQPYAARSPIDFWRRWHITLSFWLRDYLYIPLGGGRQGPLRKIRNLLVTMTLGGLWHGASWTFVIWGALHGVAVVAAHIARDRRILSRAARLPRWLAVLLTFHFVTLAWIFFRARTIDRALEMLAAPYRVGWIDLEPFLARNAFTLLLILLLLACHPFDDHRRIKLAVRRLRPEVLWPAIALGWIVAITVSQGSSAAFIYFDF